MDAPLPLRTEFLLRLSLSVGEPQLVGPTRSGALRIVPVTGGTFEGPRLRGEVLGGGAGDWLRVEPDGTTHLDVRLTLRERAGGLIFCQYTGLRAGSAEVMQRLAQGGTVDPAAYYFRTAVRFETGAAEFAWLNRLLAVGVGQRPPTGPVYDIYAIL
ncbi:DUF3237 domain-containing protein [Methylobacterium sp. ID0610]|uniref:DUF3237 domain-containing protein n=1 Tax=Methylobacterium carpenticola TaxID=3344827 RepID=UPI0036769D2D